MPLSWITYVYIITLLTWLVEHSLVNWYQQYVSVHVSFSQVHKFSQFHFVDNQVGILFLLLHVYYAHLASVRFEHSVCLGSLGDQDISDQNTLVIQC